MQASIYAVVTARLPDCESWFSQIDAPASPPPLPTFSSQFIDNLTQVFGREIRHAEIDEPVSFGDTELRYTDMLALRLPSDSEDFPRPYNAILVFRADASQLIDPERTAQHVIDSLAPDAAEEALKSRSRTKALSISASPTLAAMLDQAEALSYEVRSLDDLDARPSTLCCLYAFYITAGYALVATEHEQISFDAETSDAMGSVKRRAGVVKIRLQLANIQRRFLTISQSFSLQRRDQCETIISQFRIRKRIAWQSALNSEYETVITSQSSIQQERMAKRTNRFLLALTLFTVVSGLFFGLFALDSDTEVAERGLLALMNQAYLQPLLFTLIVLLVTTILIVLWPDRRK